MCKWPTRRSLHQSRCLWSPITTYSDRVAYWPNGSSYPCDRKPAWHPEWSSNATKCQRWQAHGDWNVAVDQVRGIMARKLLQIILKRSCHIHRNKKRLKLEETTVIDQDKCQGRSVVTLKYKANSYNDGRAGCSLYSWLASSRTRRNGYIGFQEVVFRSVFWSWCPHVLQYISRLLDQW